MRYISEALDQYTGICKEALQDCASKLSKSFLSVIIEVLLLHMVIPGKINFTQMGSYGRHCEQCYRQELLKQSDLIVADAFFSTRTFYEGIRAQGFHLISRFRDNAVLYYLYQGGPTGKKGRPRIKDGKIDINSAKQHHYKSLLRARANETKKLGALA